MARPRIFLGSSGKQVQLLEALTQGLADVADVEPWTSVFDPGTTTIGRLLELTRDVDFAAFVFGHDDWTAIDGSVAEGAAAGQASPRDNVVFEAGLFGGVLGMERTFILHAHGAKLPSDLLGLTSIRYAHPITEDEQAAVCRKLREAIGNLGRLARIEGAWWQFSLTELDDRQPAALSLLKIARGHLGDLEMTGRSWRGDGRLVARYWSEAAKEKRDPHGIFYYWNGERPLDPDAPRLHGTGEIRLESADRANGYFVTVADAAPEVNARTSGIYVRADPQDFEVLDGSDDARRSALIAERLQRWESVRRG